MSPQVARVHNEVTPGPSFQLPGPVHKLADYPQRVRQFLHEVRVEMKQVTWPTRNDVYATTAVVIATVAFFGVYFLLVDSGVGYVVQRVFNLFKF